MKSQRLSLPKWIRMRLLSEYGVVALLFGFEGLVVQFVTSVNNFGSNLYATYLGASDSQLGLISMFNHLATLIALLPVGMLANRMRSLQKLLIGVSLFMGVSYVGLALAPALLPAKMVFFYLCLSLAVCSLNTYNAQWQTFFGDAVPSVQRSGVFVVRNKYMMFVGILTPLLFGFFMGFADTQEKKLWFLRFFYLLNALLLIFQAFLLSRIKGGERSDELLEQMRSFSVKKFGYVFREQMLKSKLFMSFFLTALLFYISWMLDGSIFYIAQVQYCGFDASSIGYFNAAFCLVQLFSLSFWGKRSARKGYSYTMIYAAISFAIGPSMIFASIFLAPAWRLPVFFIVGMMIAFLQTPLNMCLVQLLLESSPQLNRAMIISIYTLFITAVNCVFPLLGVQLYHALGGDRKAMFGTFLIISVLRTFAAAAYIWRYRYLKKTGTPEAE